MFFDFNLTNVPEYDDFKLKIFFKYVTVCDTYSALVYLDSDSIFSRSEMGALSLLAVDYNHSLVLLSGKLYITYDIVLIIDWNSSCD